MSRGSCDGFVRYDYRSSVCRWRRNPQGRATRTGNIERLRADQKWTFAALSEQLGILGRPIPPLGLRKIVAETRRVDEPRGSQRLLPRRLRRWAATTAVTTPVGRLLGGGTNDG